MAIINLPYGRSFLEADIPDDRLAAVLRSKLESYSPPLASEADIVRGAMNNPIGTERLSRLALGMNGKSVVIIASDHTRPVPSKLIIPPMLEEIRSASPLAKITILIATGFHRMTTREELTEKFGSDIVERENIVVHTGESECVSLGTLPSGGRCDINKIAASADLLLSEGFIEPHFFAGFSGGRKSILPGVASHATVMANHNAAFIDHKLSRTGVLDGNPIHTDMLWAAKAARLAYIVNVVLDGEKRVIHAVAGDVGAAHAAGCEFIGSLCRVAPVAADIVITTNGGYPLDQNLYQSVKGMTAAEAVARDGGVIIMASKSSDGVGGEGFFRLLSSDTASTYREILSRRHDETVADQWQAQILMRILLRFTVIYISDLPNETLTAMNIIPAKTIGEAISIADGILTKKYKRTDGKITVIPDGIGVIVL